MAMRRQRRCTAFWTGLVSIRGSRTRGKREWVRGRKVDAHGRDANLDEGEHLGVPRDYSSERTIA